MGHMKDLDRRIRQGGDDAVAAACELAAFPMELLSLLSQYGDFPTPDNASNEDNTPATHGTPSEGSEQNVCTLTDAEREVVELAYSRLTADTHYASVAATLRGLLERLK